MPSRILSLYDAAPPWFWFALYGVWLMGSALFLLGQRRRPVATLAWLMAFLAVPLGSALIYFLFGPRRLHRRRMRRSLARRLTAPSVPDREADIPAKLGDRHWLAALARVAGAATDGPPRASDAVSILRDGDMTYAEIEAGFAQARDHLHLEYYIWEPDAVGIRWRDLLVRRAAAGVQVRVLVDALGSKHCDAAFWQPLRQAGGEVRLFNPLRLFRFKAGIMNFRTHRKIVVIDGRIAFTGGINVTEGSSSSYGSSASSGSGGLGWRDTHLRIAGAPTLDLQTIFLEDWIFAANADASWVAADRRMLADAACMDRWFPRLAPGIGPWVQIIDSGPDEEVPDIHRFFFAAIAGARQRVWITTPYFVPDEPIMMALATAAQRGVDVRLIVPSEGDSRMVSAAASTFVDEAVAAGVQAWEYLPRMVHSKTLVIDDALAVVGTANIDNRSFRLNFEVVAAIYDTDVAAELAADFERDLSESRPVLLNRDSDVLTRLLASTARLFAPLL